MARRRGFQKRERSYIEVVWLVQARTPSWEHLSAGKWYHRQPNGTVDIGTVFDAPVTVDERYGEHEIAEKRQGGL